MLLVAIKGVLARKLRLLLTSIAIVLGVGFVSGAFFLTDSMRSSFDTIFEEAFSGIDVEIRTEEYKALSESQQEGSGIPVDLSRVGIAPEIVDQVRAIDGVEVAVGSIFEIGAQPLDEDGKPLGSVGPPAFGANWIDVAEEMSFVQIVRGRAPKAGEVLLDETNFKRGKFELGDEVQMLIQGGRKRETFTLVGYVNFGKLENLNGASLSIFETSQLQELFDMDDRFSALDVSAESGVSQEELRNRIDEALDDTFVVQTGPDVATEQTEATAGFLDILQNVILAFAAIAVFVGAFTIFNTFTILIGQRIREFGLLRMLGARRTQIIGVVALEALVLGIVASTIGLFAGYGIAILLREVLNVAGFGLPDSPFPWQTRTIVASYLVGVGVTLIASVVPAWRASRLSPLEAIRTTTQTRDRGWKLPAFGAVLLLAGIGLIAWGFSAGDDDSIESILVRIGVGFLVGIVGLAMLSRLFIAPVTRVLAPVMARGTTGQIASGNVLRNRARSATTASALMIGLALAALVLVFYASLQATIDKQINEQFGADITAYNSAFGGAATVIDDATVEQMRSVDGVEQLAQQRWGSTIIGDEFDVVDSDTDSVVAYDEGSYGEDEGIVRLTMLDGADSIDREQVLIDEDLAEEQDLSVGDELELSFPTDQTRRFEVRGIYKPSQVVGGPIMMTVPDFDELQPVALRAAAGIAITVEDGVASADVVRDIKDEIGEASEFIEVLDSDGLRDQFREQLAPVVGLVFAMLSLSLVIALFGIGNTMALNVFERTREIGLLRAVGGTRRQLRRIIRVEAVLVALFGAVVGILVGLAAGFAIIAALRSEGFTFDANVGGLLAVLAGGFVAGLLASILPARRAARTDVLEAIANE